MCIAKHGPSETEWGFSKNSASDDYRPADSDVTTRCAPRIECT